MAADFIKNTAQDLVQDIFGTSQVSVSVGITCIDSSYDACYERAVKNLQTAKSNGGKQYYWDIDEMKARSRISNIRE